MQRAGPGTPSASPCGLYVHIPFCRSRCPFCAFYLEIHRNDRVALFLTALERELDWYARSTRFAQRQFGSLYLGGGTPTTLTAEQLCGLIRSIRSRFALSAEVEVSVEAHPATVTLELLERLREAGVTRLSLGAESLDRDELIRIGRPMTHETTASAMQLARTAGLENVSVDLMYGLPGQSLSSWLRTLEGTMALGPTHLSCYALTVEEDTALANQVAAGREQLPDPAWQTDLELAAESLLQEAGYRRYEVSNYARPGYECRHNLLYWQNGDYLGVGPSAQSYVDGVRFGNLDDLNLYSHRLTQDRAPLEYSESLSPEQRTREALVFGLRHVEGVDRTLVELLSRDVRWRATLDQLVISNLLELSHDRLWLSAKGRQLADSVALQLL